MSKMLPTLSNINEDNENGSCTLDKTLTKSFHDLSSKDSTLKESSRSDFETDSLERHGVVGGDESIGSPIPVSHTHSLKGGGGGGAVPVISYIQMLHPSPNPSPHHHQQQQLHGGQNPLNTLHSPNVIVNYAVQDGSLPLSPIWNQMQYFRTDTETSSNSEFITSYIERLSPLQHIQRPDAGGRKYGADSGNGESSDDEQAENGSDGSGTEDEEEELRGEEQPDNCLKWKRGRLLGKGAYGKVWGGTYELCEDDCCQGGGVGWGKCRKSTIGKSIEHGYGVVSRLSVI